MVIVRALAIVRAIVGAAFKIGATTRAIDRIGRLAIGALGLDRCVAVPARNLLVLVARDCTPFGCTFAGIAAFGLAIRTGYAAAKVIGQAESCLALKALRFEGALLVIETRERRIVLLLWNARVADARLGTSTRTTDSDEKTPKRE